MCKSILQWFLFKFRVDHWKGILIVLFLYFFFADVRSSIGI